MKRIFDILLAIMLLVILCIPMFIVALLVRLTMGSPVLFVQRRPGLHGNPFFLYKYRTMNNAKDTSGNLLSDDVRLTFTGKTLRRFSLDELPQLFNVIKGDLSFVGPRPLLMQYLPRYSPEQARRHEIKPGITGWAQVNGFRGETDELWKMEKRFEYDVEYIENWSFWWDIQIIWFTLFDLRSLENRNK